MGHRPSRISSAEEQCVCSTQNEIYCMQTRPGVIQGSKSHVELQEVQWLSATKSSVTAEIQKKLMCMLLNMGDSKQQENTKSNARVAGHATVGAAGPSGFSPRR